MIPPSNNTACNFTAILDPYDGPAAFADGTSNLWTSLTNSPTDPKCTNAANAGAGFESSQVAWGSSDQNAYATVTGLTESELPFIPPGEMSTCTFLAVPPAPGSPLGPVSVTKMSPPRCNTACRLVGDTSSPVTCQN